MNYDAAHALARQISESGEVREYQRVKAIVEESETTRALLKEYKREVKLYAQGLRADYPPFPEHYFTDKSQAILEEYQDRLATAQARGEPVPEFPEDHVRPALHNTWHDRVSGRTPDLLSLDQMFTAMEHLYPSVETIHEAIHRCRPDAFTSATFEFCDRGADHSSFASIRGGRRPEFPSRGEIHHLDAAAGEESALYTWMSSVDHLSTGETLDIWRQVEGNPLPTLSWLGLAVTDEAGHVGGPHSELARAAVRDSDARVGEVIEAIDAAGALERTAFLVIADHGMEQNDPTNDRRWTEAVDGSGVACLQVADNFIYLR